MRELNYKNQHEIGFDIDCLPKWVNYISKTSEAYAKRCGQGFTGWIMHAKSEDEFKLLSEFFYNFGRNEFIYDADCIPKNFTGNWKESLFKINRESSVHYNGTAI